MRIRKLDKRRMMHDVNFPISTNVVNIKNKLQMVLILSCLPAYAPLYVYIYILVQILYLQIIILDKK